MSSKLGRKALVERLIRQLVHDLMMADPELTRRVHNAARIDEAGAVVFREKMGAMSINPALLPIDIMRNTLNSVIGHLRMFGVADYLTEERSLRFTRELLELVSQPDADAVHTELVAHVTECAMKVIEPAIGARQPVAQQEFLLDEFRTRIAVLLDELRQEARDIDGTITLITIETVWLLRSLKVNREALDNILQMEASIQVLLEA